MRRLLVVCLLSAGSASFALAAQRGSGAPASVPPVARSAPTAAAPHAPVVAHAPVVNHAPMVNHASAAGRGQAPHASMPSHSSAHVAPPVASRPVAPPHHVILTSPSGHRHRTGNGLGQNGFGFNRFANNSFFNECSGAPGLGFDFTHFFAVHPNCNHTVFSGVVLPFVGGGFYVPMPYYDNSQAQPQAQEQAETGSAGSKENESNEADEGREAHYFNLSVTDYVFVKRDGTKIFAVAYSLTKDKLQYVTKDGLRRTLSLDALDYEATEKSNEELGNRINLPRPLTSNVA